MKSLTFAEFFALPPGTIFGQSTGLPHQFSCGLFHKGESWPKDYRDEACILIYEAICNDSGSRWLHPEPELVFADHLEDHHRFLVYEPSDLDRLARLIGRGNP